MTVPDLAPQPTSPPAARRSLAPDVARGAALLGIAVVNAALLAPDDAASSTDRVTAGAVTLLLENRTWPVFACLFGFGIAAVAARLDDQGLDPRVRNRVLRRRCLWLAAFGLGQVVLVFWGDILGVYGLTGLVVVVLLSRSRRTQVTFGAASALAWLAGTVALSWGGTTDEVPGSTAYLPSIGERLEVFAFWTGANSVFLTHLAPMLVGVALFRLGVLHRPVDHRPLLWRLAGGGTAIGLLGAVPLTLVVTGAWQPTAPLQGVVLGVHAVTGLAQGIGYVALVALWSARVSVPAGRGAASLLARIGQRPLTVYLVHSVLLGLALSPWALDLAPHLSLATTYAVGAGVWVVAAVAAAALASAGRSGPADDLLRRLARGRAEKSSREA